MNVLIADKLSEEVVAALKALGASVTVNPDLKAEDIPAAIGKAITAAARELNTLHAQDPTRIPAYAQAMMANIDAREVSRMTTTVLNAVLDQRPPLVSWAAHMLAGRVRERFSKWRRGRQ